MSGPGRDRFLLHYQAVRVGFITQLLWPRYGDFWVRLVEGAGAEARFPNPERVLEFNDERLADIPGVVFRLAAAQALSLHDADLIVAPDLNFGTDIARGGGQDAFVASFPEALSGSFGGLPPVVAVPASLSGELETRAVEFLLSLSRDAAKVRRVWERNRALATAPRYPEPRWSVPPYETVAIVAQPWLLSDALVKRLQAGGSHAVSQHSFDPAQLRAEGWRAEPRLVPTDAEVLGAARLLGRRAAVTRLRFVADATSGADAWLYAQVGKLVHKPLSVTYLQDVFSAEELVQLLRPA